MGGCVHIGIDGEIRLAELHFVYGFCEAVGGRPHERRVESAADMQRHRTLGTSRFGGFAGRCYSLGRACYDYLAHRVVVGHPHIAFGLFAGCIYFFVGQTEHCGHGAFLFFRGCLHRFAPLGHQRGGVGEAERAGSGQGRIFPEAVACVRAGRDAHESQSVQGDEGGEECGKLGIARLAENIGIGAHEQVR